MTTNQHVTFTSDDQPTNLGLRHIQTLQEASVLSKLDILFIGDHKPEPVDLFLNMEDEKAVIEYKRSEMKQFNFQIPLKDYKYLMSVFILE